MRKYQLLFFFIANVALCQHPILEDIIIQDFYLPESSVKVDSLNNITFIEKLYSKKELQTGLISHEKLNDVTSKLNIKKSLFSYFLYSVYSKDSSGLYNPKEYYLQKKFEKNDLIKFKEFPSRYFNYDCQNKIYDSISFYENIGRNKIIFKRNKINGQLIVLNQNCELLVIKEYESPLECWYRKDLLIISYEGRILIFHNDEIEIEE